MAKEIYGRGVPTKVDVENLIEALGIPRPGDTIEFEQVQEIIKVGKGEYRFDTVTAAWRRLLERKHNLVIVSNRKGGFDVLTASSRINYSTGVADAGLRKVARASSIAVRTDIDDLTPDERQAADHLIKTTGTLLAVASANAKSLGKSPTLSLASRMPKAARA